jgi:hypothetical protein
VPEHVRVKPLALQRRAVLCRGGDVNRHAAFNGVTAQTPSCAGREQWVLQLSASLGKPDREDRLGLSYERDRTLLATLAFDAYVTARVECNIAAAKPHELGSS